MIDDNRRQQRQREKDRVRRRYSVSVDPENYEYIPAKKQIDYYDNEVHQRVGVYVRVSTDNSQQTTSFELQKKYYEDFVVRHPNWSLIRIYADEGISGTSLQHRDEFNRMIADCRAGTFGVRRLTVDGTHLQLNGTPVYLRAICEHCSSSNR